MLTARKMMMLLAGAALLLAASVMSVAAAPNRGTTVTDNPGLATYIDGASHSIPGNSAVWFKFDYNATRNDDGSRNPATVKIANLSTPGMGFEVYSTDQIANWWENDPIGRGANKGILCGKINDDWDYTCQIYDLGWTGKFTSNGTVYIRVTNDSPNAVTFTLTEEQ